MLHTTLLFLQKDDRILLAMKKRGFGVNFWNGPGGKVEPGETIEEAAARECSEEIGVSPAQLRKVAILHYTFEDDTPDIASYVFFSDSWEGTPVETEEMAPKWFAIDDVPYDSMWPSDKAWLPQLLAGKKLIGSFTYKNQADTDPHTISITETEELKPHAI